MVMCGVEGMYADENIRSVRETCLSIRS